MSQRVEDYLAERIVMLRNDHNTRYDNQMLLYRKTRSGKNLPTQVTVGGLVKSYRFRYTPGEFIAQGTMYVQLDSGTHNFSATMVILGGSGEDAMAAERIVAETHKISDCSGAVVEAYFGAYCPTIQRYIVVYEPFESFNSPPTSFLTEDSLNLSNFWRDQVRTLLYALSVARERMVVHGSLLDQSSYVMSAERFKIINVGRTYRLYPMKPFHDLYDLRSYIWNNPIFYAQNCGNWASLDYLLGSEKMAQGYEDNQSGYNWENDVLQHPVLLEPSDRLTSYAEVEIFMWNQLNSDGRLDFANLMYMKMPDYRDKDIENVFDTNNPVYFPVFDGILTYQNTHTIIYLAIIQFVRNIIKHANDYLDPAEYWDDKTMCEAIEESLTDGFMGMAYSLSKTIGRDWGTLFANQAGNQLNHYY